MNDEEKICKNCIYYSMDQPATGICRRHAPSADSLMRLPDVRAVEWCGEGAWQEGALVKDCAGQIVGYRPEKESR